MNVFHPIRLILITIITLFTVYTGVGIYSVVEVSSIGQTLIRSSFTTVAVMTFCIGTLVLWFRPDENASRLFFLFCFVFSLFHLPVIIFPLPFTAHPPLWQFYIYVIQRVGLVLSAFLFAVLFYRFPSPPITPAYLKNAKRILTGLGIIDALFVGVTIILGSNAIFDTQILGSVFGSSYYWHTYVTGWVIWILTGLGIWSGIYFIAWNYKRQPDMEIRSQLRWVMWGAGIGFGTSGLLFLMDLFFDLDPIWNIGYLGMVALPVSFAFAIFKYRLMDVDLIIKRSLVYGVLTGLIILLFLGISTSMAWLVTRFTGSDHELVPIITTVILVYLFNPLRQEAQNLVNRTIYRHRIAYQQAIAQLTEKLQGAIEIDTLQAMLVDQLRQALQLSHVRLWLRSPYSREFVSDDGAFFQPNEAFINWLIDVDYPTRIVELRKLNFCGVHPEEVKHLRPQDITLCVPLIANSNVVGMLNLGATHQGRNFIADDLDLLHQLGRQAALALGYARLHAEVAVQMRLQQELEIAHQIQVGLLPSHSPHIAGCQVAGASIAATQVGGDFYDFVTFSDNTQRLGVIIGDVAGKGIPGALIMATTRSVFRAQASEKMIPVDVVNATRRWIAPDLQKGMFVAAGYFLVDANDHQLTYALAGVPYPLLIRDGVCQELPATQFRLPFSNLKTRDYDQTTFTLKAGDVIVLTTDGLEDAMNPQREPYSIHRLISLLETHDASATADDILQYILDDVEAFIGDTDPFDDVTVVVIKIE